MNIQQKRIVDFYNFVYQRHLIWYKRNILRQNFPWTNDPILKNYKFCNVYRELDKCSQYLISHVINNNHLTLEDKIFNILLYRRFNTDQFYEKLGVIPFDSKVDIKYVEKKMDKAKAKGIKLFNDAYIVCQRSYISSYRKHDKHIQQLLIVKNFIQKQIRNIMHAIIDSKRLNDIHEYLMEIPLTGDFLAYQYVTDITYLPEFKKRWMINNFVSVGPGAKPAVQYIFNDKKIESYPILCQTIYFGQHQYMPKEWENIYYKDAYYQDKYLSLSNIQNCLCEFRKYLNLKKDPKNSRKRYYKPQGDDIAV